MAITVVRALLVKVGASLTFDTSIVKVCCVIKMPSVALIVIRWEPTLSFKGVPLRLAVPSPLSDKLSQSAPIVRDRVGTSFGLLSVAVMVAL